MPDITKAQIVALIQAIMAVLIAFGIDLSMDQQAAILQLSGVLGGALVVADAIIRNGRSKVVTQREAQQFVAGQHGLDPVTGTPIKP